MQKSKRKLEIIMSQPFHFKKKPKLTNIGGNSYQFLLLFTGRGETRSHPLVPAQTFFFPLLHLHHRPRKCNWLLLLRFSYLHELWHFLEKCKDAFFPWTKCPCIRRNKFYFLRKSNAHSERERDGTFHVVLLNLMVYVTYNFPLALGRVSSSPHMYSCCRHLQL